ncbi:unnamed protein product, partial [Durusdinium trenchii]
WSSINKGTSERDDLIPLGATYKPPVRSANKMVCRCVLLMCLVVSMDSVFLVENPAKSSILNHPRMQWLFKQLRALDIKVWRAKFWMAAFKAPTPKPTMCISNSETIRALQTGTLGLKNLAKDETKKTVVKYQDGSGKWRYQGSKALKETQIYTPKFASTLVGLTAEMKTEIRPSIPPAKPDVHLIAVVAELVWSSWDEGELEDALLYMMGSSRCRIPAEWAQHVPTAEHLRSL